MNRGLYVSGWSMLALEKRMDVIANNMANASTNGYKKDGVVMEAFPDVLTKIIKDYSNPGGSTHNIGTMSLGSDIGEIYTNFTQGQLASTGNDLDLAINGSNAFFTIASVDADGNEKLYFTRDGAFQRNNQNVLVTKEGNPVLGQKGLIVLGDGDFSVAADGTVSQNGEVVDKLLIAEFADTTVLKKYGNNLLQADEDAQVTEFTGEVMQGYLEQSNVNIVKEMVDMITVQRAYEANQKVLKAMDGTLEKAVNEVGAVR